MDHFASKIDFENPLIGVQYLGDPMESFLTLARSDGWEPFVCYAIDPPDLPPGYYIQTCVVKPRQLPVLESDGRLVAIGWRAVQAAKNPDRHS